MFSLRLFSALGILLLTLGSVRGANAKTFVVTSTADTDGSICGTDCTLRQAINAANSDRTDADVIVFDEHVFATKQTIEITGHHDSGPPYNGLPSIFSDVSIIGPTSPGMGVTLRALGGPNSQVLQVSGSLDNTHVYITNLTLCNARVGTRNYGSDTNVTNCTFSHNDFGVINNNSSYIYAETRALYQIMLANLSVDNSTFFENKSNGVTNFSGNATLNFCTVTGSERGVQGSEGNIAISNSIVAGNMEYNLCSSDVCTFDKIGHNITSGTVQQAGLDPRGLSDNGGATETVALVRGEAAQGVAGNRLATDQRGVPRSQQSNAYIGAFEYEEKSPSQHS